jgi:hypothetical protein
VALIEVLPLDVHVAPVMLPPPLDELLLDELELLVELDDEEVLLELLEDELDEPEFEYEQ